MLQNSKKKIKEILNWKTTIDFGKINPYIFFSIIFVFLLIIGYANSTDLYQQLNSLPEKKNELDAIKGYKMEIHKGNILNVSIDIKYHLNATLKNLMRGLNVRATFNGLTQMTNATDVYEPIITKNKICFNFILLFNGKVAVQLYFYNQKISPVEYYNSSLRYIFVERSNMVLPPEENRLVLDYVCLSNGTIVYFGKYNGYFSSDNYTIGGFPAILKFYSMKQFVLHYNISFWDNSFLIVTPPQASTIQSVFLNMYSTFAQFQNNYFSLVYDREDNFDLDKDFKNIFNITVLNSTSNICFRKLIFPLKQSGFSDLRNFFDQKQKQDLDRILIIDSKAHIENMDDIVSILKDKCSECEVKHISEKLIAKYNVIDEFSKAKYIVGVHNEAIFSKIISASNATVICLVPGGNLCKTWIRNMAIEENIKFIEIPIYPTDQKCKIDAEENITINTKLLKKFAKEDFDLSKIADLDDDCSKSYAYLNEKKNKISTICKDNINML